jgi:hypothetical protein
MPFANTSPFRGYASALRFSRQHGMFFVGTCCLGFDGTGPCETGLALFFDPMESVSRLGGRCR